MPDKPAPRRRGGPNRKRGPADERGILHSRNKKGHLFQAPFEPTPEQRDLVRQYALVLPQKKIAAMLGISISTLHRHFRAEYLEPVNQGIAKIGAAYWKKALDGNIRAQEFILKTIGGWSQHIEVTGRDGGSIQAEVAFDFSGLSDEDLDKLEAAAEIMAAGGRRPDDLPGGAPG